MPAKIMTNMSTETSATLGRLVNLRWWLLAGEVMTILLLPPLLDVPLPTWLPACA